MNKILGIIYRTLFPTTVAIEWQDGNITVIQSRLNHKGWTSGDWFMWVNRNNVYRVSVGGQFVLELKKWE